MEPWMLMQEMYIISGRPMMSGKMAIAILNHSLAEPLRPTYSGDGDDRTISLTGRPEGEETPPPVTLKVKDAKTDNAQWKKNPDQMLMYAAARMWGRRYTPDIILGIVFDDEEIPGINAPDNNPRTPIATPDAALARTLKERPPRVDPHTGEVFDAPVALPKAQNEKWYDWGVTFVGCLRTSPDVDTADRWLAANADMIAACAKEAEKVHGNLQSAVKQFKLDLLNREEGS
jgi:hypothetical protein